MLLGRLRRPEVSPRCKRLGAGLPGLLGSCFWSFCLRQVQAVAASILRLPGFLGDCSLWMLTVALAPDSERTLAFGRSFCSVSGSAPSSLVASWCGSLGACLPFVPFLFLWSHCHSRINGQGVGEVLPIGLFPLSALGLPCLRSDGGRQGRQSLAGPSVIRDGCLVPVQVSPLPLLHYLASL